MVYGGVEVDVRKYVPQLYIFHFLDG